MEQFVKCGFAGDNFPREAFPCMVGRPMLRYEEGVTQTQLKVRVSGGSGWFFPSKGTSGESCVRTDEGGGRRQRGDGGGE